MPAKIATNRVADMMHVQDLMRVQTGNPRNRYQYAVKPPIDESSQKQKRETFTIKTSDDELDIKENYQDREVPQPDFMNVMPQPGYLGERPKPGFLRDTPVYLPKGRNYDYLLEANLQNNDTSSYQLPFDTSKRFKDIRLLRVGSFSDIWLVRWLISPGYKERGDRTVVSKKLALKSTTSAKREVQVQEMLKHGPYLT